jgi:hypothetical protein
VGGCTLSKAVGPSDVGLPANCPLRASPVKLEADPAQLSPEVREVSLPVTVSAPPRPPCEDCGGRGCVRCADLAPMSERGR